MSDIESPTEDQEPRIDYFMIEASRNNENYSLQEVLSYSFTEIPGALVGVARDHVQVVIPLDSWDIITVETVYAQ